VDIAGSRFELPFFMSSSGMLNKIEIFKKIVFFLSYFLSL